MGGGISKKHVSKIIIDRSNKNEIAHVTINGCFYNHPVELILKDTPNHSPQVIRPLPPTSSKPDKKG